MHGCCTGPFEAPGHPFTELSGRLAHSGSLQGASESSQGYRSRPHPFSWPQDERQEECAPPISANRVSRGSFGFRSDAGPFGSCPDSRSYSVSGLLQARPSCLCRYLPQAFGPHGSGLPCVAPRVASHEAVPLVDEGAEVTPHCTCYSPYQGITQLLSTWFSVSETCMDFAPGLVKVTLRPRPGYNPKVLSTSFRSQVVTLHSFHPPPFASSEDERLHLLCPVRALKLYVDRSKVWIKSPQLLICFDACRRGLATSKQRISYWVRDAISLAYLPSPLSLRAHSTRGVASSQALFLGVPLEDICVAAGWSSPHTFVKFYNLDVDTAPGSQILSV